MTSNQQGELILVSPYFIPSAGAIENIGKAVDSGITVGILTPSLAANNQPLAHSHYKKKRKPVIASGARLFELRADPPGRARELAETAPIRGRPISLHAKALVGDRSRCFIGSLNLDPRAMRINTESGLLIDSPELAGKLLEILRSIALSDDALEVVTDDKDRLQWRSSSGEMLAREPASSLGKRILSFIGGLAADRGAALRCRCQTGKPQQRPPATRSARSRSNTHRLRGERGRRQLQRLEQPVRGDRAGGAQGRRHPEIQPTRSPSRPKRQRSRRWTTATRAAASKDRLDGIMLRVFDAGGEQVAKFKSTEAPKRRWPGDEKGGEGKVIIR